ncbi:MAG: hypothetical protein J1E40_03070 [Oscillospiraceae bacterium]|nr:hypothetical protein [Oscillospiraceae bacterium]
MKKILMKVTAVLIVALSVMSFAACGKETQPQQTGMTKDQAESVLKNYLTSKGFDDDDFLAEGKMMDLDGVRVYAFSWRTKVNENADKLFGTYAVSLDGLSFYEYQSDRETWIRDIAADWNNNEE